LRTFRLLARWNDDHHGQQEGKDRFGGQIDSNAVTYVVVAYWLQEGVAQPQIVLRGHKDGARVSCHIVGPGSIGTDAVERKGFGEVKATVRHFQVFQDRGMGWRCGKR